MLTIQPMSGYDLKRFCEQSLAFFWYESYGNLYPRLKRLKEAGLIRGRRARRARAPDAVVYTLTQRGRRRFREWMREPAEPERIRSEFLLKVFFGSQSDPASVAQIIREHAREQQQIGASYSAIEQMLDAEGGASPDHTYWLMSLRRGQLLTDARLRWCREAVAILEKK